MHPRLFILHPLRGEKNVGILDSTFFGKLWTSKIQHTDTLRNPTFARKFVIQMNRLILIGNGFDLAHGITSSFNDFIEWYLAKAYNTFLSKNWKFNDVLLDINLIDKSYFLLNNHFKSIEPSEAKQTFINLVEAFNREITTKKVLLLERIMMKSFETNWVDIEMEYFKLLSVTKGISKDKVDELNNQFDYLRSQFLEYLQIQEKSFFNNFDKTALVNCFTEPINENGKNPETIHFLNFNYTNTLEAYVAETNKIIPSKFNYIHGNLDGSKGEPIFGYGDEMDKKFAEFEHDNDNRLFRHIKSFGYLKNSNYADLLRFIQSDDFQVHIYGHSCGLSDRTMLHEIFEHTRCKSIKIFYHEKDNGTNDFTDKTYEIYRHFNDKELVRKRIVDFSKSSAMPQPRSILS